MAKSHPANASGPVDAWQKDVGEIRAADTAYAADNASSYDQLRTVDPVSKRIHKFERDILMWALSHMPPGGRALEIGCGTGRMLTEGLAAGYVIDGVDGSGPMLEQLKSKLPAGQTNIDLILAEAAQVPREGNQYDMVYAVRLLNQTESVEYALSVVDEMMRLAKPGGYVLVEFINAYRPRIALGNRPTVRLTPAQVAARGKAAGGTVVTRRGAFLLSMQAYKAAPEFLRGIVSATDRGMSWLLPRLCSRSYVLFRKN